MALEANGSTLVGGGRGQVCSSYADFINRSVKKMGEHKWQSWGQTQHNRHIVVESLDLNKMVLLDKLFGL